MKRFFTDVYRLYSWILAILIVAFSIGVLIGWVLPTDIKLMILESVGNKFSGIINQSETLVQLTGRIFLNNLTASGIVFMLGFTVVLPLFVMLGNGMVVGLFLALLHRMDVMMPGTFISGVTSLIPHGIFELSAFFLAGAFSSALVIKAIFHKYILSEISRRKFLLITFERFIICILPLLVAAAFVEVYVSNRVGGWVGDKLTNDQFTETLAISLDSKYLLEHNCAPTNDDIATNLEFDTSQLVTGAKVIYDDAIYAQLQQRSSLPYWTEYYACDNGLAMDVQTWPRDQWSIEQAKTLQAAILTTAEVQFTTNPAKSRYTITNDQTSYTVYITSTPAATVYISLSEIDLPLSAILKNIEE